MPESLFNDLPADEQIKRLRLAVEVMASWLVQAQTGFATRDAQAIFHLIELGPRDD